MKVVTVGNGKGGVGKSTISQNLAVCAMIDGKSVLLIDADSQGSTMNFRAIRETDDIQAVSITQATIHKDINNFSNFDLIIIDAGGRDNTNFRSAIMAAQHGMLLIPVLPSQLDIWATEDTFKILQEARTYVDIDAYTLINRAPTNTNIVKDAREMLGELALENNITILETAIYARVDFMKSISQGQGVIEFTPNSKAAKEAHALYGEVKTILGL